MHEQKIKLRGEWSKTLKHILWFVLVCNVLLLMGIGLGWLKFDPEMMKWVVGGLLAEPVGLVFVVVHYLFDNKHN